MRERPVLWGDGSHNDRAAIRHLFKGGMAYCRRAQEVIMAPTLDKLPPGLYRTLPGERACAPQWHCADTAH